MLILAIVMVLAGVQYFVNPLKLLVKPGPTGPTPPAPDYAAANTTELRLDQIVYTTGSSISAAVTVNQSSLPDEALRIYVVSTDSQDVEAVLLRRTVDPNVYVTENPLPIKLTSEGAVQKTDGKLSLKPNEMFIAFFTTDPRRKDARVTADFGLLEDKDFKDASVKVMPELALTLDEKNAAPGGLKFGTAVLEGRLPVQFPVDELIIYPRDQHQLDQFLKQTQGKVISDNRAPGHSMEKPKEYLVKVNSDKADLSHLSQLRALWGDKSTLYVSSQEALKLAALTIQYVLDGFIVGVNPRLQLMGTPTTQDGQLGDLYDHRIMDAIRLDPFPGAYENNPRVFSDGHFGVPKAWAYLALMDRDTQRIPVAFIDNGFAPNPDFRGYDASDLDESDGTYWGILQRDIEGDAHLVGGHLATAKPTIGPGYFSPDWFWHGSAVVTTAGGVLNNGWGTAGTGGQVVVPRLYRVGSTTYHHLGLAIISATDDGADVISISAGWPCNGVSTWLVVYSLCDRGGADAFCGTLGGAASAAAVIAALAIPIIGGVVALFAGPAAFAYAFGSCSSLVGHFVDTRGPLEDAVRYAHEHGVTVVGAAGNTVGDLSTNPLCALLNCGDHNVDDHQIVPCVLNDDVICVGATYPTPPYDNGQLFGPSVDIWAPQGSAYYAPPLNGNIDDSQIPYSDGPDGVFQGTTPSHGFWGTSATTPYVAGIVADMIAVNPNLDRRNFNPATDQATIRAIPDRIRGLLSISALECGLPPRPPRGYVVHAFCAVEAAAVQRDNPLRIPEIGALGFETSLGFDESTPAANDRFATAPIVLATLTTHILGTILTIPGYAAFHDIDFFRWQTPANPGIYRGGHIWLEYPRGFGTLLLNGQPGTHVDTASTLVETRDFPIPDTPQEAMVPFWIDTTVGPGDNVYRITFFPAVRIAPPPGWPSASITYPPTWSEFIVDGYDETLGLWYKDIPLQGSASDPQDGTLTGNSLVWTTDRTDIPHQNEIIGHGTSPTVRLYSNVCTGVWHVITLTATDRDGNTATAQTRVLIYEIC